MTNCLQNLNQPAGYSGTGNGPKPKDLTLQQHGEDGRRKIRMCRFKSGIILKTRCVVAEGVNDSHTDLLEKLNIEDTETNAMTKFVRAELLPPDDEWWTNPDTWKINVDQDILPDWYEEDQEKYNTEFRQAVKDWWKEHVLIDQKIDELSSGYYCLKRCEVRKLLEDVQVMCNSSIVQKMCDSSTVQRMYGNSIVQKMCDSSTVQVMWNSSTVREMCDSSKVQKMFGGTVQRMYGNSIVQKMCDSSTVREMCDSSTVQEMCDSSTVREMCDSSTVLWMFDSSTVQVMCNSSTVQEMRDSSTVQVMCNSSTVQEMCDSSTVQKMYNNSIARDYHNDKLYISGGTKLEIVRKNGIEV